MLLELFILIFVSLVHLGLGTLVYFRAFKRRLALPFFLFSIFIGLWVICNGVTNQPHQLLWINSVTNNLAFFFGFLGLNSGLWFVLEFAAAVREKTLSRHWKQTLVALYVIVGTLSLTNYVCGDVTRMGDKLHFSVGTLLPLYFLACIFTIIVTIVSLARTLRFARGSQRQQTILIMVAFSVPPILALMTNVVIPSFTNSWQTTTVFGPIFMTLTVAIIAYAIIKHSLFDVRPIVARTSGYVATVIAVAFFYGLFLMIIARQLLRLDLHVWQLIVLSIATGLSPILFNKLKRYFDHLTNAIFYKDSYDSSLLLDSLNKILVSSLNVEILLKEISTLMRKDMKLEFCNFVIDGVDKSQSLIGVGGDGHLKQQMKLLASVEAVSKNKIIIVDELEPSEARQKLMAQNVAMVLCLVAGGRHNGGPMTIGYCLLGQKKSDNIYNYQDLRLLETIANELSIAIQNAVHFKEIENFNSTLQDKILEATKKLRYTNEKLRVIDQNKDDFISMSSHQLRTPLTAMKGYVSMVLDGDAGKLTSTQRRLLTQAFVSSQRMVYIISDLLNVSRLRTGQFVIDKIPTNLAKVVKEEVEQLTETAKSRGLDLIYKMPKDFPRFMLDEPKLRQVIMNFIDNAIYYTPEGGEIIVELRDNPQTIELTVKDQGIGVPKHEQHRLFTKFFRAQNAQRMRPDGTGLGLFMARRVIVMQGGAIIFRSQENKGSTFGFSFAKTALELDESTLD